MGGGHGDGIGSRCEDMRTVGWWRTRRGEIKRVEAGGIDCACQIGLMDKEIRKKTVRRI